MKKLYLVLIALLVTAFMLAGCSAQTTQNNVPAINATGTGKITTQPDTVELRFSVATEGKDNTVQVLNATTTQKVIDAIIALGIPKEDLQTQNINFSPRYKWDEKLGQQLIGYRAENTIVVKTKKTEDAGRIIDIAVQNGSEMVGNLQFTLSDEGKDKLLDEAINKAVADAKKQAEAVAKAAGVQITGIKTIDVRKDNAAPPIYYDYARKTLGAGEMATTPVLPEDTDYIVTVVAAFLIK